MKANSMTISSLVTSDEGLYHEAVQFYHQLGFILNAEYKPYPESDVASPLRTLYAKEECALVLPSAKAGDEAVLNIRFAEQGLNAKECADRRERLLNSKKSCDWRVAAPVLSIFVDSLDRELFESLDIPYQAFPHVGTPMAVYVVDPLGTLIGFLSFANPVSDKCSPRAGIIRKDSISTDNMSLEGFSSTKTKGVQKRIGVLTSGGDSPGMNAAVRAVVRMAIYNDCVAFAIYEGYRGLVKGGDYIKEIDWDDVRGFLGIGGTSIGTARCPEFFQREGRLAACQHMIESQIDSLVVIGGDGSLTGADIFRKDWPDLVKELLATKRITQETHDKFAHITICGILGSIDNDMAMTDVTIGSYSSLDRICTNVDWIEATAESHSRAFVVEVMGRHCGWLALMTAQATRADYFFIPENPSENWQEHMSEIVKRHRENGRRRIIVIVAEGAIDTELNPINSEMVKEVLVNIGLDTRVTTLGHVQRGGPAVALDRYIATAQGVEAVRAILEATIDTPSPMIGIRENKIVRVNLVDAVRETKKVAKAIEAKQFEKARQLRDAEFNEHLANYISLCNSDKTSMKNAAAKPLNFAIVVVGAPAGGMNAAIAAAGLYCLRRGHTPWAIYNAWTGLARHESFKELSWLDCDNMFAKGGCDIGCNRNLPDVDLGMIAYYFGKYHIDGLIIIGGFEAYKSLQILDRARSSYPSFRIPMVCLPATISNNVPGSDISLGADTCLNTLVEYCDVVKQSASATRRRVFVIEVQGGMSGFIAAYCALICGAYAVYTPEYGISLSQLSADIKHLRECFAKDEGRTRAGRLIIRNEKASSGFTTADLASIFETESHGRFDAREGIPGHLQQGGLPSPLDRVRATRLAVRCVSFLEQQQDVDWKNIEEATGAACVIGVKSSKVTLTPVRFLWEYETEVLERRSNRIHWKEHYELANILTRRPGPAASNLGLST